jgi:membrane-bound serine protease (ClpP class)
MALRTKMESDKGFTSQDMRNEQYVGREGVAQTILRPSGKVNIDGDILDATAEHGYIEAGEKVKVSKFENAQLFVKKTRMPQSKKV